MTTKKENLAGRMSDCGVDENMSIALCNYFSADELEGFVEFLEEERDSNEY